MKKDLKLIFQFISRREKIYLIKLSIFQSMVSLIEVIAIGLSGYAGTIAVSQLTQTNPAYFLNFFELSNTNFLILLMFFSGLLLIIKTILSIRINSRINFFLGRMTSRITNEKLLQINHVNYDWIKKENPLRISYFLGQGISGDYKNTLLGLYLLTNELIFIIIIIVFLAIVNILVTLVLLIVLLVAVTIIHRFIGNRFQLYGNKEVEIISENNSLTVDLFNSFKELTVSNKINNFQNKLMGSRLEENLIRAEVQSLEQLPKYLLEVFIVLIGMILFASAAIPSNAISASSTIVIFGLALTRMAPSLLRMQNGLTLYKQYGERFYLTGSFFHEIELQQIKKSSPQDDISNDLDGIRVELKNISFSHDKMIKVFQNFSTQFTKGKVNCIQGISGVGKSTLAELVLGLLSPNSGTVEIDGVNSMTWRKNNPGSVYYLPQDPFLFDATVLENVSLESDESKIDIEKVENLLKIVGLEQLRLSDKVLRGELSLSGGEKQKLGIARALYSGAQIMVLDEPTSSMDETNESRIFEILTNVARDSIVILITHSLNAENFFESITRLELN